MNRVEERGRRLIQTHTLWLKDMHNMRVLVESCKEALLGQKWWTKKHSDEYLRACVFRGRDGWVNEWNEKIDLITVYFILWNFDRSSTVSCELKHTLLFSGHTPECSTVLTACQKAENKLISIFKSPIDSKYLPLFLIDFCISGGISAAASFRKPSLVGSFNLPAPWIKGTITSTSPKATKHPDT